MRTHRLFTIGIAATAAVLCFAQGVSLKRVAKAGDTLKYKIKADIDIQGMSATFTSTLNEKVIKVEDNGNIVSESTQTDSKVKIGADEMDAGGDGHDTQTTTATALGEVLELKGDMVDGNAYRVANMNATRVPDKALNVGDTWEVDIKGDKKLGSVSAKGKYKVEKAEKIGAWDTYLISFEYKETEGGEPASSSGKIWISTKDGAMVKLEGEWKNAPLPGAPGPISAKISIDRV